MDKYIEDILTFKVATYTASSPQATNSQRRHLIEIFSLILQENLKHINEYGYSEISRTSFKKIDDRHYKSLLHWLEDNQLIQIRRSNQGKESFSGTRKLYAKTDNGYSSTDTIINEAFCKGYRINPDLVEASGVLLQAINESSTSPIEALLKAKENNISKPSHSIISDVDTSLKVNEDIISKPSHSIISDVDTSLNNDVMCGNSSEQATVATYPNWTMETSWNNLSIENSSELSKSQYNKYKIGLQKIYKFSEGRYYGQFHNMNKDHIQYLRLFGEAISEWGDGEAFFVKLMGKLIEEVNTIPYNEKVDFQRFAINDPYIFLMKKLYLKDRDEAKKLLNIYINSTNQVASRMKNIDSYFEKAFPNIRLWLRSIPVVKVKDQTGKIIRKKQLWKLNQNMEYQIMKQFATMLNETYGVFPLTKHDAIYLNESDIKILEKNNVEFSSEMKKTLNYQYYNDLIFEI